jgi:uncharacterized protein Veg
MNKEFDSLEEQKREIQSKRDELYRLINKFIDEIDLLEDEVYSLIGNHTQIITLLNPKVRRSLKERIDFLDIIFGKAIFQEKTSAVKVILKRLDETYNSAYIIELEKNRKDDTPIVPIYIYTNETGITGDKQNITMIKNSKEIILSNSSVGGNMNIGNENIMQTHSGDNVGENKIANSAEGSVLNMKNLKGKKGISINTDMKNSTLNAEDFDTEGEIKINAKLK